MDCGPSISFDVYNFELKNLGECNHLYADNSFIVVRYYCKLTNNFCVADKHGFKEKLFKIPSINQKILIRCPSRKEISDVVEEKSGGHLI